VGLYLAHASEPNVPDALVRRDRDDGVAALVTDNPMIVIIVLVGALVEGDERVEAGHVTNRSPLRR
jgi:hypothetical protein